MARLTETLARVRSSGPEDRNQARVLDAALLAFLDFGVKRTSMVEVTRRCGLSLATLYRRSSVSACRSVPRCCCAP